MTGGSVLILGDVGDNFAAGMSGGRAWAWDPADQLPARCNPGMVVVQPLSDDDAARVLGLLARHHELTRSPRAADLLASWPACRDQFKAIVPRPPEPTPTTQTARPQPQQQPVAPAPAPGP